jgi:hypothetical protein
VAHRTCAYAHAAASRQQSPAHVAKIEEGGGFVPSKQAQAQQAVMYDGNGADSVLRAPCWCWSPCSVLRGVLVPVPAMPRVCTAYLILSHHANYTHATYRICHMPHATKG